MKTSTFRPLALGVSVLAVTALLLGRAQAGDDDFQSFQSGPMEWNHKFLGHGSFSSLDSAELGP